MKERIFTVIIALTIITLALFIALINYPSEGIVCTADAKECPDGSYVGRDAENNCEFSPCPSGELEKVFCKSEERNTEACIEIYQPVCGWFNSEKVQCVSYPCAETFSNSCFACINKDVLYWTEGECPAVQ